MTELATQARSDRAHFTEAIDRIREGDATEIVRAARACGAAQFERLDFPHHRQEEWRFTDIRPIIKTPFRCIFDEPARAVTAEEVAPFLYDESDWTQLVFVDGFFQPALSRMEALPEGVFAGSLAASDGTAKVLHTVVEMTNAYIALNAACLQDGAVISIAANTQVEAPIHCLYVSTGADGTATHPRTLVHVGQSAEVSVIESFVSLNETGVYLCNAVAEMVLEDNAKLSRHKVVREGGAGYHLSTTAIRQARDSRLESFVFTLSGKITRDELNVTLAGPGAECELNGLYLNDGERLIDNALFVEHASGQCHSRMGYKGILNDRSRAVFTGKVLVPRDSQQTDSDQLNNNLLLSDEATIDSKPQLEIFADDVKCTHGATVGAFPPELVFYFQSRGMSAEMASGILTYGFGRAVADGVKVDALRKRMDEYIFDTCRPTADGDE